MCHESIITNRPNWKEIGRDFRQNGRAATRCFSMPIIQPGRYIALENGRATRRSDPFSRRQHPWLSLGVPQGGHVLVVSAMPGLVLAMDTAARLSYVRQLGQGSIRLTFPSLPSVKAFQIAIRNQPWLRIY